MANKEQIIMTIKPDAFRISRQEYACPKCNAQPGKPCILVSGYAKGRVALTLHNERLRAASFGNTKKE